MSTDKCCSQLISHDRHLNHRNPPDSLMFKWLQVKGWMLLSYVSRTSLFKVLILSVCQQPLSFLGTQPTLIKHTFTVKKKESDYF